MEHDAIEAYNRLPKKTHGKDPITYNMKVLFTANKPTIESEIDPRFGRGAYFIIVDTETLEWQAEPNPGISAAGGAGIRAAQFVSEQKCDAIASGDFGPNAFEALTAAGISMFSYGPCRTVAEALAGFKDEKLDPFIDPARSGQGEPRASHRHKE